MRPRFFNKRAFWNRVILLMFLSAVAFGHWEKWVTGRGGLVVPIVLTVPVVLLIVFSRFRKHLIIGTICGYIVFAIFKGILFEGELILGLMVIGIALLIILFLEIFLPDKEPMDWLYDDEGLGESDESLRLNLTQKKEKSAPNRRQS